MNIYNPAMLCDLYEFTMANAYDLSGTGDRIAYFDMYFRDLPDNGGFAIACGLESLVRYISELQFTQEDIAFLRGKGMFSEQWLDTLRDFHFSGDVFAVPEGTVVFPGEPILTVRARADQAQIIETFLLICLNHQSLIATKASRIVRAAGGRAVMEFGARRAMGGDAALYGARAAYIAGCCGSSNTLAEQRYGVPSLGTMAHSWIQMFDDEYTAFKTYCSLYPENTSLLVDTYNVLHSGVPNAIRVFSELKTTQGSIRIDSGDITYLSIKARAMLDEAGMNWCKIIASNSLDEQIIREVIRAGGCIDSFGVGERLITAKSDPVFGGVYKLVAIEEDGEIIPKIKVSENVAKITTPHFKKIYRLYEKGSGKAIADYICLHNEVLDASKPLELFDPSFTWKRKIVDNFVARELLVPIFLGGRLVYECPDIESIRSYCEQEIESLWDEVKRFSNPHNYYVDLSPSLWEIKDALIKNTGQH